MLSRYRLRFTGKSGAEAEDFVDWVRQRALDAGKLNDPRWTAELASGCFIGGALRWYTSLDAGIRGDWDTLQQAIFLQYGESFQEGSSLPIVPKPAPAAAAPNLSKPRTRGRIRVQRENESGVYYLSKILQTSSVDRGRVMVTSRILEALVVEYEPLPPFDGPRALFVPDNQLPGCDTLGMKWRYKLTKGNNSLRACGINSSTGAGSPGPSYGGPILTKPWKISPPSEDNEATSLWGISESGTRLLPLSDKVAFTNREIWFRTQRVNGGEISLELFFEPM